MIPKRAPYSGQAYKLYADYNEIHIFVEDAGFENFYKVLFKKNGIKIEHVFSKNGKDSILRAAKDCSDTKCVFVVDRDWTDLFNAVPLGKNVVVLDMYSIESYLIDYDAFSGIILGDFPKCDIDKLFSKKSFEDILTEVSDKLRPLFECFAAMQKKTWGEKKKSCSYPPGRFQQENASCAPDITKIEQFISESGVSVFQEIKDYFSEPLLVQKGHGKYMLHYIWNNIRSNTKAGTIGMDRLMIRLAQLVNTREIEMLVDKIKRKALTR